MYAFVWWLWVPVGVVLYALIVSWILALMVVAARADEQQERYYRRGGWM